MKKIECPLCDERYTTLDGLYEHIEEDHEDEIPKGMVVPQYLYFLRTGKTHGKCVVCKAKTEWNEVTGKYNRFCTNPKCKEKYREQFKKRMINKYGKTTLLNDPEQQRLMLSHRKISGEYKWTDGSIKTYTGTYELDFLKFLDAFMNFDSEDVFSPSPHTYYYEYKGEKKFYIPDVWIPSLNLEVEIKESDNKHPHMQVDREKERLKDRMMSSFKNIDYIKIVDKKYDQFFAYLDQRKEDYIKDKKSKFVSKNLIVKESFDDIDLDDDVLVEIASNIDKDFKPKGKLTLSTFKKEKITDNLIKKYSEKTKMLRHVRTGDNIEGYVWINKDDDIVGFCSVDTSHSKDEYNWILAIEVNSKYQGYGLGKQLLHYSVSNLKANALSVNKKNLVAKQMYERYGFKTSKESEQDVKNGNKIVYFMYLHPQKNNIKESFDDIDLDKEPILESSLEIPEFKNPQDISKWMQSNIRYSNFTKLKSSQEVLDTKCGDCHSQCNLLIKLLRQLDIHGNKLFFIEYNDNESSNAMTHTLVWYRDDSKKVYWIENAWGGMKGVHGPYNSLSDLKQEIINIHSRMPSSKRYPKLHFSSVGKVETGINLGQYVNTIIKESYEEL